ncbi:hypothetical protein [Actinokineospora diospyrosa]|uniref:Uncharacterized protein n=1 Tax=Actinokineospora diospyrosa TaxID=103728 RepID=A0ABT1I9H0_9PSEU|nr:hypothetical protein [Actinokineospora diospyrosa]MCP2269282.1 hypothetical protein [Actinokineospora diospyrosa]
MAQPNVGLSGGNDRDLEFEPIANGVDFLASAITHLHDADTPRSLKYAVLHLLASIEILVKVRLQREGFEHVFDDPYVADEHKLRLGKFRSVSLDTAITRLAKVADINFSKDDRKALSALGDERNKLQHYGSTSSQDGVTSRAVAALDVLSQFIHNHLIPNAPQPEIAHLKDAERLIREAITTIEAVYDARIARITPELDAWHGIVIHCPACLHLAWTWEADDQQSRCRLCDRRWFEIDGEHVAEEYAESVLGESRYLAVRERTEWSVADCLECGVEALVRVQTRSAPRHLPTTICFHCGFRTADRLGSCGHCGRTISDPDASCCEQCWDEIVAKD